MMRQKKTAGFWEFVRIFPGWSECRFGLRIFFLIYTPLVIGPILYILYYIVMRVRRTATPIEEDTSNLQVTKIESHYYRN